MSLRKINFAKKFTKVHNRYLNRTKNRRLENGKDVL